MDGAEDLPEPEKYLAKGSKGGEVEALQSQLMKLGYDLGKWGADGDFGSATESAVKEFQANHGLPVTGVADDATMSALLDALERKDVLYTITIRDVPYTEMKAMRSRWPGCEVSEQ